MSNYQRRNPVTYIFPGILFLAMAMLSWYLLDRLGGTDQSLPPIIGIMIKAALALAIIAFIILISKQIKVPARRKVNNQKLEKIIGSASSDPELIRSAIIRLRQILDPDQKTLAVNIATLLDQLLSTIDVIRKEQASQQQENISLSKTTQDLQTQQKNLINAPHLRSEFIARMGDEITLPMDSLGTMLKLLKGMDLEIEAKDLLVIATHGAHSLMENLTNILQFSKLDAQLLILNKSPFHLAETISSVLETQESIALSKSLLIETHINPDVPKMINGDQQAIIKVLDNLISNAIRFTDQGYIRLVIDLHKQSSKKFLRFTIIDTGVGIPESALDNIFDSLTKDTDLVNSSFTGRLRLIVCKQLCELMGGEIGVRSKNDDGCQFWFTVDISS